MTHYIEAYGCVKCQTTYYKAQPIYRQHIFFQSKHGISRQLIVRPINWQQRDPTMPDPPQA